MIIAKSPLRISLGGGGTDLPSYYKKFGGFLISATIDKHVYVSIAETFNKKFILKYSKFEEVTNIKNIKHPIFRETLKYLKIKTPVNISSHADIPAGTGLGSSGSFTVSLIHALSKLNELKIKLSKTQLAETACKIEINILREPVGKQDQYTAAFGGINEYYFKKKQGCTLLMLSPLFFNIKYSENKILGPIKFNLISNSWDNNLCALGGVSSKTLNKIKLTRASSIAFISLIFEPQIKKPAYFINRRAF